jgi:hypothetical protein
MAPNVPLATYGTNLLFIVPSNPLQSADNCSPIHNSVCSYTFSELFRRLLRSVVKLFSLSSQPPYDLYMRAEHYEAPHYAAISTVLLLSHSVTEDVNARRMDTAAHSGPWLSCGRTAPVLHESSTLDGEEWWASRPGRFIPMLAPGTHRRRTWMGPEVVWMLPVFSLPESKGPLLTAASITRLHTCDTDSGVQPGVRVSQGVREDTLRVTYNLINRSEPL